MIELPFPNKVLWPNGRAHWGTKAREFRKHKQWAYHAALAAGVDAMPFGPFVWSATFYPKTRHTIDDDNARASLKAYQDGLALALAVDDKLFPAPTIHFAESIKNGKVVIVIREGT
jgi:crossover junction endodeoxyribonuclease RusA